MSVVAASSATTLELAAECHACDWRSTAANAHGNAAQHHKRTGHAVTVDLRRRVVYGDPLEPIPGQEELFE